MVVLVNEASLSGIASAIRSKNGTNNVYKPGQMAAAIQALPGAPTLQNKTATQNGTVTPDTGYDGLSQVTVNVPNSYSQSDEGKVVSNGALVAQTARSGAITQNGTYDTTNNNEVTVNVSGGGGGGGGGSTILSGASEPTAAQGNDGDIYLQYEDITVPSEYTRLAYIESQNGAYINTQYLYKLDTEIYVDFTLISGSTWAGIFSVRTSTYPGASNQMFLSFHGGTTQAHIGVSGKWAEIDNYFSYNTRAKAKLNASTFEITQNNITLYYTLTGGDSSVGTLPIFLFGVNMNGGYWGSGQANAKLYRCIIAESDTLVRDYVPVRRNSDMELGLYDRINNVFYTNNGSGTFIAGDVLANTNIDNAFLKVNSAWQNLIGSNINDVGGITV